MRIGLVGARRGRPLAVAAAVVALTACGGDGGDTTTVPDGGGAGMADSMTDSPVESAERAESAEPTEPAAPTAGAADEPTTGPSAEDSAAAGEEEADASGVYRDYSPELVDDPSFDTTILFFHASWCPECRAFDESITSGAIPEGVQILRTDYDSETDLKQRYGVTIQSTFVKVGSGGEEISSWVGYGKDRSIDTILDELE